MCDDAEEDGEVSATADLSGRSIEDVISIRIRWRSKTEHTRGSKSDFLFAFLGKEGSHSVVCIETLRGGKNEV